MKEDEQKLIIKKLNSVGKIDFPKYQFSSILNKELNRDRNTPSINFKDVGIYNKISKILYLDNGEIYKGEIKKGNKYKLIEGEYTWPSGQIFQGKFNENNEIIEGKLTDKNKYVYTGEFKNSKYDGEGEFKWNNNEYIIGEFKEGCINGKAMVKTKNILIQGNFKDSEANGVITEFNAKINESNYQFPKFTLRNGEIQDDSLIIKKDNKDIILDNKINKIMKRKNINMKQIKISEDELKLFNKIFNLFDNIIPKYEKPSIPEEGLIEISQESGSLIKFKNGIVANFNYDEEEYQLYLPNGEKLIKGRIDDDNCGKYWLEEGNYFWPSGQEYSGKFSKKNIFHSEDAELKIKDQWEYKGNFVDGGFNGNGVIKWKNGNFVESYFLKGKLNRETNIKWENFLIKGYITSDPLNEFEVNIDDINYKIVKSNKNIKNEGVLIVEKNENEYFLINCNVKNEKNKSIVVTDYNCIGENEKYLLLNCLNTQINIPSFELVSIAFKELIIDDKVIFFENNIFYNRESNLLIAPNHEKFIGKLKLVSNKYLLDEGEYKWPNGQIYIGKFNEKNNFEGDEETRLIYENIWEYKGGFKDGKPFGNGKISWKNGDYIKGYFENGKIYGETYIKLNGISFKGNYTYSIINGTINNINISNNNHTYKISKLTINKGNIQEDFFDFCDEMNNNHKVKLDKENKKLLSDEVYKEIEFNEEDLLFLFKSLSKIRKINLPYFSLPKIKQERKIIQDGNNSKVIFENNERFLGKLENNNGNFELIEGVYEWPFGQKYKGRYKDNKFNCENAELKYKDEWIYKGGFKNGNFEGKGVYENNKKGISIKGNFKNGNIRENVILKKNDVNFEGNLGLINELYIKNFQIKTKEHNYQILEFKMNDNKIKFNKSRIEFHAFLTHDLKLKIIESLIIKAKNKRQKFFFNEPFNQEISKENKINVLKIEDNINSQKLSKISIQFNRLNKKNRDSKNKIGHNIGIFPYKKINLKEVFHKIKVKYNVNEEMVSKEGGKPIIRGLEKIHKKNSFMKVYKDKDTFRLNKTSLNKDDDISKNNIYNQIEEREIIKGCNFKMLQQMENEINLINKDIKTLRDERELIEKEKRIKLKKIDDINYFLEIINFDYKQLNNKKSKIEILNKNMEENIENYEQYFKNNNNKNFISESLNDLENKNIKILKEIKDKEEIIKRDNKEKNELMKKIEELENLIQEGKKIHEPNK